MNDGSADDSKSSADATNQTKRLGQKLKFRFSMKDYIDLIRFDLIRFDRSKRRDDINSTLHLSHPHLGSRVSISVDATFN